MRRRFLDAFRINKNALVAVVALALLLFVNVGFVAMYQVAKMRWYHQQLVSKPGEETVTLLLTKDQFYNGTKEYEWKINGESYDMRSFSETDCGIVVIAVHDPYEHQLMNILTAGFRDDGHRSTKPLQHWVKLFASPFELTESCLFSVYSDVIELTFPTKPFHAHPFKPELIHPPRA